VRYLCNLIFLNYKCSDYKWAKKKTLNCPLHKTFSEGFYIGIFGNILQMKFIEVTDVTATMTATKGNYRSKAYFTPIFNQGKSFRW